MNPFDIQVKVVLLGNPAVGKSSILKRFVLGDCSLDSENTVGAKFMGKLLTIEESTVKLNIWDTAGQERYQSFSKLYCRDAGAVILVYDVSDPESFQGMKNWYEVMSKEILPTTSSIFIAGNKTDTIAWSCSFKQDVVAYADEISAQECEVSAKTGAGIDDLFMNIAKNALTKKVAPRRASVYLTREVTKQVDKQNKKCC